MLLFLARASISGTRSVGWPFNFLHLDTIVHTTLPISSYYPECCVPESSPIGESLHHFRRDAPAGSIVSEFPQSPLRVDPRLHLAMPQNYGATSPPATPSSARQRPQNGQIQATPAKSISSLEPQGTVWSSTVNLANTTIGAGALAFPSAFSAMGLVPGIMSCLISATTAAFGLYLLSRCATQVGQRPGDEGRKASFNEVARISFGKGWITRLFDVSLRMTMEHAAGDS